MLCQVRKQFSNSPYEPVQSLFSILLHLSYRAFDDSPCVSRSVKHVHTVSFQVVRNESKALLDSLSAPFYRWNVPHKFLEYSSSNIVLKWFQAGRLVSYEVGTVLKRTLSQFW